MDLNRRISAIAEKIAEIKRSSSRYEQCNYIMKGAFRGYNRRVRPVYFSAPLRPDQLDHDTELADETMKIGQCDGVEWADKWYPLISTRLGGNLENGYLFFAMNDKLTPIDWQEDEDQVYEFLSSSRPDEHRSVLIELGIEYNMFFKQETCRPYLIHRLYTFLINGQPCDRAPIAGTFENTSPKPTHRPRGYKGEFKFIPDDGNYYGDDEYWDEYRGWFPDMDE